MYAVVEDRGKQYKVSVGEEILVDSLQKDPGTKFDLGRVIMLSIPGKKALVGSPTVEGAVVHARVLGTEKGPKVISFTLRRRKDSRRKVGHRQRYTRLRITDIKTPA
jgi:large subunit ribosomal protein L21